MRVHVESEQVMASVCDLRAGAAHKQQGRVGAVQQGDIPQQGGTSTLLTDAARRMTLCTQVHAHFLPEYTLAFLLFKQLAGIKIRGVVVSTQVFAEHMLPRRLSNVESWKSPKQRGPNYADLAATLQPQA